MEGPNRVVYERLNLMAEILEILGDNPFKVRAYRRAAESVARLAVPVDTLSAGELEAVPGIGAAIAKKIREIVETGTFHELETVRTQIPPSVLEMLSLEGVGPKTVSTLWKKMNILSIDELERAARGHRIRALKGFGPKKEEAILRAIAHRKAPQGRMTLLEAERIVGNIRVAFPEGRFVVAGSFRRRKSTIGDIDIVTTENPSAVNPRVREIADEVLDEGTKKTSFRYGQTRVDVRFVSPGQCGAMLLYLTGSKNFNIKLREFALSKGLKLNEYGIEDVQRGELHAFAREGDVFSFLGMDFIVPELREDWGEVEAALSHTLPNLVEEREVRGDLHVHSSWSDGHMDIRDLAEFGARRGYEFIACTDHSSTLGIAHGLDEQAIAKQAHEIEVVNRSSPCRVLHGIEVDILADGKPGLPARVLSDLDIVVGSVHSGFSQDPDVLTRRVVSAIENEHIDIIGHPTGRIIGEREPYGVDMRRVIEAAAEHGKALECNASPFRMDIDDIYIREAVKSGVKVAVGTDAHAPGDLDWIRYGVGLCRRGWATPADVLNPMDARSILEWAS
ncbi:MAG: DNA polymerase/3'-5' exonuclease PolX [Methanolinea sp.]